MELLAPAGDAESLMAALANGADAVYFGLDCGFNARGRTGNFKSEALVDTVSLIHDRGALAYLTVNTLIFEPELTQMAAVLRHAAECGVDAFIIQDPAVALLAHHVAPDVERHASTQMTISSGASARFAESLHISRIIVPRELRATEISRMSEETDLELEVFVHGALCVAWSGQCLTSEAWAGRSANRGQCNQSCRMPYDLVVDGERRELGEQRYLLSPGDLMGAASVPDLKAAGVVTLKIEGRQKGPQYVATATRAYRDLLDGMHDSPTLALARFSEGSDTLALSYSRGFGSGFLQGINHQRLVDGRFPKHRGLLLGEVLAIDGNTVTVSPAASSTMTMNPRKLTRGMGVVFDAGQPEDTSEPGGPIFDIRFDDDGLTHLSFGEPGPKLSRVRHGNRVWVTSDPGIAKAVRGQLKKKGRHGRCAVSITAEGGIGQLLTVTATSARNESATATSSSALQRASSVGLNDTVLCDKLGTMGDTPYFLDELSTTGLESGCFLPVKELKVIRRELLRQFAQSTSAARIIRPSPDACVSALTQPIACDDRETTEDCLLPLCRSTAQLEAVIAAGLKTVELDFMELVGLKAAVRRAREAGLHVVVASLRVQKPGEDGFGAALEQVKPDAVLVRHWGALDRFRHDKHSHVRLHGDFSLNVTNSITARHLLQLGLDTVTASHDLDRDQLMQLAAALPRGVLTVPVQHRTPTFHTEHCVYAHVLSDGQTHLDCDRPCEKHELSLIDHTGLEHPIIVDAGCRNTVFHGERHSAGWMIPELRDMGVHRFRIEFVRESQSEAAVALQAWAALLRGECSSKELANVTESREQFGVAEGGMVIAPLQV